jgi:hypothetical protein
MEQKHPDYDRYLRDLCYQLQQASEQRTDVSEKKLLKDAAGTVAKAIGADDAKKASVIRLGVLLLQSVVLRGKKVR